MHEKPPTLNSMVTCTKAVQGHTTCYANMDEKRLPRPYPKLKSFDFVYSMMDEKREVSFLHSQAPISVPSLSHQSQTYICIIIIEMEKLTRI